jgi:hypothetical protein
MPSGFVPSKGSMTRGWLSGRSPWPVPRTATHTPPARFHGADVCSTETCGAVEDGVENGLQVVRRASNGAHHFRDGRLLLDEFDHPIFQLRSGPFSVDTLVQAEQFLGLTGEDSITGPAGRG